MSREISFLDGKLAYTGDVKIQTKGKNQNPYARSKGGDERLKRGDLLKSVTYRVETLYHLGNLIYLINPWDHLGDIISP